MSNAADLEIYVGSVDYFWEGEWRPTDPEPPLPEGLTITRFRIIGVDDRQTNQKKIRSWRDRMTTELDGWLSAPLDWDETDPRHAVATPGSKCWMALMYWAAYAEFSEEPPAAVGDVDLAQQDPIFCRLQQLPASPRFVQILQSIDYWLPASFDTVLDSTGPGGDIACIGSSPVLLEQLKALNDETWKADRATIQAWSDAGRPADEKLESQARYAFAEFLSAAQFSCDHRLPMIYYLDKSALWPKSGA